MIIESPNDKFYFMSGYFEERLKKIKSLELKELRLICFEIKQILESGYNKIDSMQLRNNAIISIEKIECEKVLVETTMNILKTATDSVAKDRQ